MAQVVASTALVPHGGSCVCTEIGTRREFSRLEFRVTASSPFCAWTANTDSSFLRLHDGASGTGDETVRYSVDEHTGPVTRIGIIKVGNATFTVTQFVGLTTPRTLTSTTGGFGDAGIEGPGKASFPPPGFRGGAANAPSGAGAEGFAGEAEMSRELLEVEGVVSIAASAAPQGGTCRRTRKGHRDGHPGFANGLARRHAVQMPAASQANARGRRPADPDPDGTCTLLALGPCSDTPRTVQVTCSSTERPETSSEHVGPESAAASPCQPVTASLGRGQLPRSVPPLREWFARLTCTRFEPESWCRIRGRVVACCLPCTRVVRPGDPVLQQLVGVSQLVGRECTIGHVHRLLGVGSRESSP